MVWSDAGGPLPQRKPDLLLARPQGDCIHAAHYRRQRCFPASPSSLDVDEWLGALKPTWYSAGPMLHRFMFDKTKALLNTRSIHGLRFVVSGGASLSQEVREGLSAALGVPVLEHYGSSEASSDFR